MITAIAIPPEAPYFNGHFPGRPIVAGVVLLHLACDEIVRQTGERIRGISFARFRHVVGPGDALRLSTAVRKEHKLRFEFLRADSVVANGEFILGALDDAPCAPAPLNVRHAGDANWDALVPQRPPMRFVRWIAAETESGLACGATIPSGCGLTCAGQASAVLALEAAAQTAAAWEALRRSRGNGGSGPRVGYVVAIRDVTFYVDRIAADSDFIAEVQLEQVALPMTDYAVQVNAAPGPVLRGRIATFLTGDASTADG
jgi:3-hydroxymyristoyl/3-hydroxydecanoyl-(acyl carrier protein) dehydratase